MQLVWKNEKTGDAVLAVGTGFIAAIGRTGTVFIDTFATLAEAQTAKAVIVAQPTRVENVQRLDLHFGK